MSKRPNVVFTQTMDLFSERRWRNVSAKLSNIFGSCPWRTVYICYNLINTTLFYRFINVTAYYHLGQYILSSPFYWGAPCLNESNFFLLEIESETTKARLPAPDATTTTPNPYSTNRNSKQTATAWKSKIDFKYLQRVQSACFKPMEKLGYRLINSQDERDDPDFDVLEKSGQEVSLLNLDRESSYDDNKIWSKDPFTRLVLECDCDCSMRSMIFKWIKPMSWLRKSNQLKHDIQSQMS